MKEEKGQEKDKEMQEMCNACQLCKASQNVQFSQDKFSKC